MYTLTSDCFKLIQIKLWLAFSFRKFEKPHVKNLEYNAFNSFAWKQIYLLGKYSYLINVGKTRLHTVNWDMLTITLLQLQSRQIRKKLHLTQQDCETKISYWKASIEEKLIAFVVLLLVRKNRNVHFILSIKPSRFPLGQVMRRILGVWQYP